MTSREHQSAFARYVGLLIAHATKLGYELTFGEAWRPEWVAREYERRGVGKKNSSHCKRLAIDLNLFLAGKWLKDSGAHQPLGEYWESLDTRCVWGGRFAKPDGNHYSFGE